MAEEKPVDTEGEFPTEWHRETYIEGLKREVEGARLKEDEKQEANAQKELARLGVSEKDTAEKRPRSSGATRAAKSGEGQE